METQTEKVLADVGRVINIGSGDELVQKATRYFTWNEKQSRKDELDQLNRATQQPGYIQGAITSEGRQTLNRRKRQIEKDLVMGTPPELTGATRDALAAREKTLEATIRAGMLTTEEMRRNPAGAVDRHRKWERLNKPAILEWKNIRRALNPDSDEKDLSNVEVLRPSMLSYGLNATSTFMGNAQIPGKFAMTPLAKDNWPLGEPKVDTPLKQAERNERKVSSQEVRAKQVAALAKARAAKTEKKLLARALMAEASNVNG